MPIAALQVYDPFAAKRFTKLDAGGDGSCPGPRVRREGGGREACTVSGPFSPETLWRSISPERLRGKLDAPAAACPGVGAARARSPPAPSPRRRAERRSTAATPSPSRLRREGGGRTPRSFTTTAERIRCGTRVRRPLSGRNGVGAPQGYLVYVPERLPARTGLRTSVRTPSALRQRLGAPSLRKRSSTARRRFLAAYPAVDSQAACRSDGERRQVHDDVPSDEDRRSYRGEARFSTAGISNLASYWGRSRGYAWRQRAGIRRLLPPGTAKRCCMWSTHRSSTPTRGQRDAAPPDARHRGRQRPRRRERGLLPRFKIVRRAEVEPVDDRGPKDDF